MVISELCHFLTGIGGLILARLMTFWHLFQSQRTQKMILTPRVFSILGWLMSRRFSFPMRVGWGTGTGVSGRSGGDGWVGLVIPATVGNVGRCLS